MRKIGTLLTIIVLCIILTMSSVGCLFVANAASSTASVKGFDIDNLIYINDQNLQNKPLETDKHNYGKHSSWNAVYKYVVEESDGTKTCYFFVLVETSIDSFGKESWMFYFRNKKLTLNIDFVSERVSEDIYLAMFRPESSDSTTSYTLGINLAGSIGSNSNGLNNNFQASLSFSKSVTYDTVSLTVHSSSEQKYNGYYNSVFFQYDFLNYADGAMVSPNIGLVSERMVAVYAVENYDETERFTIDITSTAYIFKDAHWPASNYTYEDVILHTYTV